MIAENEKLRGAALASSCEEFGFVESYPKPILVVMEIGMMKGSTTLVSIRDRNPSIYVDTSGNVICGIADVYLRAAATRLVEASELFIPMMEPCDSFPKTHWGKVRFYVRTPTAIHTVEQAQIRMSTRTSAFSVLFDLCNEVVDELLQVDQQRHPALPGGLATLIATEPPSAVPGWLR